LQLSHYRACKAEVWLLRRFGARGASRSGWGIRWWARAGTGHRDRRVRTAHQRAAARQAPTRRYPAVAAGKARRGPARPLRAVRGRRLEPGGSGAANSPVPSQRPAAGCTSSARSATGGATPRRPAPERSCGPCSTRGWPYPPRCRRP